MPELAAHTPRLAPMLVTLQGARQCHLPAKAATTSSRRPVLAPAFEDLSDRHGHWPCVRNGQLVANVPQAWARIHAVHDSWHAFTRLLLN
ncbi:MAG: hypothetical protein OXJ64_08840, partial [Boseongicola sp.]|nr:hypothetical protein [Boseongicola sp.]